MTEEEAIRRVTVWFLRPLTSEHFGTMVAYRDVLYACKKWEGVEPTSGKNRGDILGNAICIEKLEYNGSACFIMSGCL